MRSENTILKMCAEEFVIWRLKSPGIFQAQPKAANIRIFKQSFLVLQSNELQHCSQ